MKRLIPLLLLLSAGSASAETLYDASTSASRRASLTAMAKETGPEAVEMRLALQQALGKINKSVMDKHKPVQGRPYDPKTANAAIAAESYKLLHGKTRDEIFAMAAQLP